MSVCMSAHAFALCSSFALGPLSLASQRPKTTTTNTTSLLLSCCAPAEVKMKEVALVSSEDVGSQPTLHSKFQWTPQRGR